MAFRWILFLESNFLNLIKVAKLKWTKQHKSNSDYSIEQFICIDANGNFQNVCSEYPFLYLSQQLSYIQNIPQLIRFPASSYGWTSAPLRSTPAGSAPHVKPSMSTLIFFIEIILPTQKGKYPHLNRNASLCLNLFNYENQHCIICSANIFFGPLLPSL